jgi:glucose/arabinose dehydrogenase
MANGRASGNYEVFVDGFIDAEGKPTPLGGRPTGLAQGKDGELYLSDDSQGRIWRIQYAGESR